jgi:PhnB protein
MQTSLHLNFNGQCDAAFKFYESHLGGKIEFMMAYEGSPAAGQVPADWRKKVLHASLRLGGQVLMGCDAPASCYQQPQGFSVSLQTKDPDEADRVYSILAEGGQVRMPMQETFWATRFGMVIDRFGIPWMINCEKAVQDGHQPASAGSAEEREEAAAIRG